MPKWYQSPEGKTLMLDADADAMRIYGQAYNQDPEVSLFCLSIKQYIIDTKRGQNGRQGEKR